jgi:hypothetical protein
VSRTHAGVERQTLPEKIGQGIIAELRSYIEDYGRLSALYEIVRNAFNPHRAPYADIAKKTEALVREQVAGGRIAACFGLHASLTLSNATLERCRQCDPDGWGLCRRESRLHC